ncbi:DUF3667 domain-containing protein [Flavobacterium sp. NST-5]|uniref:DUF3667 domain-containing protein n=1 Tax=Flavobacterium ichthyis TaxID=2698827 RepID=A0ABW9ZDJ6_9FLAO|nr:DUF3667 domain-containing protein [Flavobacterium ichthyis]NBL65809.1 DUF3667 domain-containing protein [Flavobacterium ichthyis]
MGNHKIRIDKTCLNCNYVVDHIFCPNCGQENSETRQSFHYLFTHFAEDLTHYDSSFWKTMKALLLQPGKLTNEYLSGKRKKYVPPVKLYIFISFMTFLIPNLLPDVSLFPSDEVKSERVEMETVENDSPTNLKDRPEFRTIKELDSLQSVLPVEQRYSPKEYRLVKTIHELRVIARDKQLSERLGESFMNNLPKVLFLYMPLFAFFLWLLHDKKQWIYFDSGVFTLHYFSLLLMIITLNVIFNWLLVLVYYIDALSGFVALCSALYCFFYFFRSHRKVFGESKIVSRTKSFLLFFINLFWILVALIGLFVYSLSHVQ